MLCHLKARKEYAKFMSKKSDPVSDPENCSGPGFYQSVSVGTLRQGCPHEYSAWLQFRSSVEEYCLLHNTTRLFSIVIKTDQKVRRTLVGTSTQQWNTANKIMKTVCHLKAGEEYAKLYLCQCCGSGTEDWWNPGPEQFSGSETGSDLFDVTFAQCRIQFYS